MIATATDPLALYERVLRHAATGRPGLLTLTDDRGRESHVDAAVWCRRSRPGDAGLVRRCTGPTLDVGCGPGRLTAAVHRRGTPALGIDVSAAAVRLARRRGATVLRRDVFGALPGHGRWRHLLLADGNIGIGGDPVALLRRCRDLLAPHGCVHAEIAPAGSRTWAGPATIRGHGTEPAALLWAEVAADDIAAVAGEAAMRVVSSWREAGRWFVTLTGR